jgi:hypothetical protein
VEGELVECEFKKYSQYQDTVFVAWIDWVYNAVVVVCEELCIAYAATPLRVGTVDCVML